MTREEIYRLARDAWLMDKHDCSDDWFVRADIDEKNIVEFAAMVAEKEQNEQSPEAITIWNKAIDAAASKAHGVGDDGLYYQIKDLKK